MGFKEEEKGGDIMWEYPERKSETKFLKLPRVAESILRVKIKEIRKGQAKDSRFNFHRREEQVINGKKVKVDVDLGYNMEIETTEGKILTISNWGLYREFMKHKVNDGDTIDIEHPDRGVWKVTIINKANDERNNENIGEPDVPF